jgi:CHAT domain-containing protein
LYRLLLAPVERDLAGQAAVVIIPDGPLWDVAFQVLQPNPRHFLIEQMVVSYAPSMAVLRETLRLARDRRAAPPTHELLALGNPAGQEPLPEAERQVREIEKLYGPQHSRVLIGEAASQGRLKADAANYRVLHLASHAVLDGVNPMYSRVLLARSAGDAGSLEARELMQFNLRADVLVLSACETARGALAGEGINGMLWAAFVAGAPTTVASLWRVESASTTELMIGFHRNWLEARRSKGPFAKAAALQKAAVSLIAGGKYAHPFYWAGFILVGSPN